MSGGKTPNLVLKRMQEKHSTTEENIRISKPKKRDYETCTKRKFQMKNQTND